MYKSSRSAHRALVPIAALPLLLSAFTGILFSFLDQKGGGPDWLLEIHTGHFGPLDLSPFYVYVLGICVITLVATGSVMWFRTRRASITKG